MNTPEKAKSEYIRAKTHGGTYPERVHINEQIDCSLLSSTLTQALMSARCLTLSKIPDDKETTLIADEAIDFVINSLGIAGVLTADASDEEITAACRKTDLRKAARTVFQRCVEILDGRNDASEME